MQIMLILSAGMALLDIRMPTASVVPLYFWSNNASEKDENAFFYINRLTH